MEEIINKAEAECKQFLEDFFQNLREDSQRYPAQYTGCELWEVINWYWESGGEL